MFLYFPLTERYRFSSPPRTIEEDHPHGTKSIRTLDLPFPRSADDLDAAIARTGLRVTLRGTFGKFPGCVHWHLKRSALAGTLEVTWWPTRARAWATVQHGREAEWIDAALAELMDELDADASD